MKKIARFIKGYEKESILAPLFKMLEAFFDLLVPLVVADIINHGIADADTSYIIRRVFILVALALAGMLSSFTAQYFAAKASVGFATALRQSLFDHIQSLSYTELDTLGTDTLITRMTSDTNQVQTGINMALRLLLRSPFIVFGSVIMAFTIDVKSGLVFIVAIPILSVVVYGIMIYTIPLYRKVQERLDRILAITRENLTGVRVIRAFCKEQDEIKEFDEANESLTKMNEFVGKISALMNPLSYLLIQLATIALIYVGALQVHSGAILQGDVVALYNYMAQVIVELIKLASLIITINKSLACADRIATVFDVSPSMVYPDASHNTENLPEAVSGNAKDPSAVVSNHSEDLPEAVSFDHVSLTYAGAAAPSLDDITFTARKGQTIGIIGATGSGKSSLVNLISRFYDATVGNVYVNGNNVKDYAKGELVKNIGVVPQKAVLFAGSIRDNLKWGNENADDEALWQAIRTAQAEDVVLGKQGALDYKLSQNGKNLSGGQRQRLTIARALVKKPAILILDDSASALDFATDAALRRDIAKNCQNTTVFLVSQRTSSVRYADRILVLDDGKLVGNGTHDELMQTCNTYREIFYSQFPEQRGKEVK